MIISPHPQGSVEWLQARCGIPTASEFDNLITPTGELRKGEMPKTYLATKLAEWWTGGIIEQFNSSFAMEQGQILESEAVPWFELEYGVEINRVGLCTTDDGKIGCSPDGLIGQTGIEIKCPRVDTHVGYLLAGVLPKQYTAQVQGCMFVTGARHWRFLSYCRRFPQLVLTVERDIEIQDALHCALDSFLKAFEEGKARLCEMNGGPPRREIRKPQAQHQQAQEQDEIGVTP